jgi:hypothetical protein
MNYKIIGACERCKMLVEIELNIGVHSPLEVGAHIDFTHKPNPINGTPACGGHIRVIGIKRLNSAGACESGIFPLELWAMLYECGKSFAEIAEAFGLNRSQVGYHLSGKPNRHGAQVVQVRPIGRRKKTKADDDWVTKALASTEPGAFALASFRRRLGLLDSMKFRNTIAERHQNPL